MLSGIFMLDYALNCKIENPEPVTVVFRQSCLIFGFFLFLVPLAVLYTRASRVLNRADFKILDWALIIYCAILLPLCELLGLWQHFYVLLVVLPALIFRAFTIWYLKEGKELIKFIKKKLLTDDNVTKRNEAADQ